MLNTVFSSIFTTMGTDLFLGSFCLVMLAALMLAGAMCFSLAACGNGASTTTDTAGTITTVSSQTSSQDDLFTDRERDTGGSVRRTAAIKSGRAETRSQKRTHKRQHCRIKRRRKSSSRHREKITAPAAASEGRKREAV